MIITMRRFCLLTILIALLIVLTTTDAIIVDGNRRTGSVEDVKLENNDNVNNINNNRERRRINNKGQQQQQQQQQQSDDTTTTTTTTTTVVSTSSNNLQRRRKVIINGHDVIKSNRYPYFVSLQQYGAGVLIAPDIILTAGHTKPDNKNDVKPHVGTFYFQDTTFDIASTRSSSEGRHNNDNNNTTTTTTTAVHVVDIIDMIRHPKFHRKGDDEFEYDFTIIKIKQQLNSITQFPRINRNPNIPSSSSSSSDTNTNNDQKKVIAIGLGLTNAKFDEGGEQRPTKLQQVTLDYIPNDKCEKSHDDDNDRPTKVSYYKRIKPSHLCTWTYNKDSCAYDSGGPIILSTTTNTSEEQQKGNQEQDLLVGLVSWGIGCADPVFPGVNARISYVSEWIDKTVCKLSNNPPIDFSCGGVSEVITNNNNNNNSKSEEETSNTTNTRSSSNKKIHYYLLASSVVVVIIVVVSIKQHFLKGRKLISKYETMDNVKIIDNDNNEKESFVKYQQQQERKERQERNNSFHSSTSSSSHSYGSSSSSSYYNSMEMTS